MTAEKKLTKLLISWDHSADQCILTISFHSFCWCPVSLLLQYICKFYVCEKENGGVVFMQCQNSIIFLHVLRFKFYSNINCNISWKAPSTEWVFVQGVLHYIRELCALIKYPSEKNTTIPKVTQTKDPNINKTTSNYQGAGVLARRNTYLRNK